MKTLYFNNLGKTIIFFIAIAFSNSVICVDLYVSGASNPAAANGRYVPNGTYSGYNCWVHESGGYYLYNDTYTTIAPGTDRYWNLDTDFNDEGVAPTVIFYSSAASTASSPALVPGWAPDTGFSGSLTVTEGSPIPEIDVRGNGISFSNGSTNISSNTFTNLGSANVSGETTTRTYSIYNIGGATLTLSGASPYITIGGTNASDFSVTAIPSNSIASAGGSTTFQITFNPSGEGNRNATISIGSNDSDENPFTFDIQGYGFTPRDLVISDITNPAAANGIYVHQGRIFNFQYWKHETQNYYLYNDLFDGVSYWNIDTDTDDASSLFYKATESGIPKGLTGWTVQGTATQAAGGLIIGNANPLPEINVVGNSIAILDDDMTPVFTDHTHFGSLNVFSGTRTRTFTIQNTGDAVLTLSGPSPYVVIEGSASSDYTVTTAPSSSIAAGGSTTFVVTFDPSVNGTRTATISISSNDSDENPYNFSIKGDGFTPQNLIVSNITTPADAIGNYMHQGIINEFQYWKHETLNYYIYNDEFSGTRYWNIDNNTDDAASYFYSDNNNDNSSPVYVTSWHVETGSVGTPTIVYAGPEIDVKGNSISIADNDSSPSTSDHTDFGSVAASSGTISRTFTIYNTGHAELNLSGTPKVDVTGINAADFTVTVQPSTPVSALTGSTTFTVVFDPSGVGTRSASLSITSDDSDENPYNFSIQGTGIYIAPTTQANTILFSSVGAASMAIGWTSGNGSNRAVFLYEGNSGNAAPIDNTTYTANTKFKSGTQIAATGWYCVYNGAGTSVNVTGLMPGSTYRAMVCEYNGTASYEAYNTITASGNPANQIMHGIIINEVDADTPGTDAAQFIELYSMGTANVSLNGLTIVLFNGNDNLSYRSVDLDGYSTDASGYFVYGNPAVIGVDLSVDNSALIQNGADAVALYVGDATEFPNGTSVTTTSLVDALVYDNGQVDDAELLVLLNGGEPQVNEDGRGDVQNNSNQRIPNGSGGLRNTSSYAQQPPTPDAANYAYPEITSATYDYSTNQFVITGNYFVSNAGGNNDVDVSLLTIRGEGGNTYTLSFTSDVEISSATQFGITLTGSDIINIEALLNKDGTTSATNSTTYNLAAADNWLTGAPAGNNIADATNGITVSNFANPIINSSTYDVSTGQLVATGTNLVLKSGATNDVDASLFTFTGQAGGTYILTNTSDVEITSSTQFIMTLSAGDKLNVDGLLNKNGTQSAGGTTYNLAAAEDWMTGSPAANNIADATTGITVSNVPVPTIALAAYDYTTNTLVVTGTGLVANAGAANDVDISKLTFTGEDGATYTITNANDVELTSATEFSITLSGTDLTNVEALLNKNGTSSADATTYNLAAAEDWLIGADAAENIADLNGNGITINNYTNPAITSATYDVSAGLLVVTGTNLVNKSGVTNDIDASLFTIKGEGDNTYQLTDTPDVEITSATAFTLILSATDKLNVHGLLNKNGLQSAGATVYNLAASDNWMQGSPSANDIADATNGITVSNVQTPTITSATYDSDIGIFVVTGTNLFKKPGTANDIDVSKFTVTGEGGTYTITSTTDAEITSATEFTFTITGTDLTQVNAKLDLFGTQSSGGTTYNLAASEDWLQAADAAANIADLAGNGITVVVTPKITSATYNAATGVIVVTGTNIQANGGGADIDASKLTITGEGGDTYTLTDTPDVERTSATQFTLTLSVSDWNALLQIKNKNGTASTSGTTYNIAGADDWCTNVSAGNTADLTGNGITASNVPVPAITSATYNAATGVFVITCTGLTKKTGALNDIDISKLTVTGEGGATYNIANTADVEITSGTQFTFTLNAEDKNAVNLIINKNGTLSTSGTTYNLVAAEEWAAGADAAVNVVDAVGNGITASNVPVPVIISASYHWSNGILTATGTGFTKMAGPANDMDASKFTFRGEGGATYTLVGSADVEITSATVFAITLDATDKAAVNIIINKPGTQSNDNTVYNLAAAEDWAQGADAAVYVVDATTPITAGNFNNSPTGGNDNVNTYENANYTFKVADFTYNDIDSDIFAGIRIETIETAGELKYNNVDVTAGFDCPDVSKLVFIPQSNTLGSPYATFTFKVKDFRGACSDAAYTMTISVLPEFISGILGEHQNLCYNVVPARLISTTPTGGVAPYAYQWQSSTDGVNFTNIAGETMLEYQPPVLAQSTYYRILQTPTCCGTIATNIVKITVHGEFIAGSISESQVLYYRTTPEKFIGVAPTGGKTPYSYQWQSSFDGSNFTDIYGATSLDYQAGGGSSTTYFRLKQTSASGCGTVYTDKLTMVVFPEFQVGSIKEDQYIAYNTVPEKLIGKEPRGGWPPYSYQWQSSTDKTNFINIPGATNLDYQPSVLTDTTYYRLMQSSSHNYADKATNVVTIYVYPQFAVGSISDDQTVCFNTAPDLLIGTEPTGGNLPYTYQWQQSSDGVNFTDIAGANNLNYQAPAITVKTFFRQIQTSASNCGSFTTDYVTITIQAQPTVDIGVDQAMICSNQGYQLFAIAENYGSVTWISLGDGRFSNINILNPVYTPGQNDIASGSVTLVVNAIGISACEMLASDQMPLSFYPTPVVNAGKDLTVYENSQIQLDATVTGSGNYSYLWFPAELVSDPTIINPVTKPITDSTTLILRVTDIETGCSFYDQVTFKIEPGVTYQISGVISTIGLKNTLPVTNVFFTGINKTTVTNDQGEYSMMVPAGYSGWAIPSRPGYVFEPDSIAFLYVGEDLVTEEIGGTLYMRAVATPDSIIAGQSVQLSVELINSTYPITVCSWQDENGEFCTEKSPSVVPTQSTLYTVYIQDAYEKTFDTVRVYVSTTTGIDDQKTNEDKISLYPNPTKNIVHIEIGGVLDAQIISIVNPNGILVRQIKLPKSANDQIVEINLENLIKGSYYLLITNSKGELIATKKVIKI